jgi:hypothetical protein
VVLEADACAAGFAKGPLDRIGTNVKLTLADTATTQPVLIRGDFDIGTWNSFVNVDDPDATFSEISTSNAVRNFTFHSSLYTNRRMESVWLKT